MSRPGTTRRAAAVGAVLAALAAAAPARAELYYLIVAGLGGEPKYQEQFDAQAAELATVARRSAGSDARVTVLRGAEATREALTASLDGFRAKTKPTDSLVVFLIGHGSFDGEAYKLNLPGRDIDGAELGQLLTAVPARSQLIVNATSASGAVLEPWAAEGRTVITATRSGFERNATRFAEHWTAALADGSADINKNGVITAQEAFDYASREVADSFEQEGTLATEHPQINGGNAARFNVARLQGETRPATLEVAALTARKEAIDGEIEALRQRREQMPAEAYMSELQKLLVELAIVQGQIDEEEAE
jgi:hypothetical protein